MGSSAGAEQSAKQLELALGRISILFGDPKVPNVIVRQSIAAGAAVNLMLGQQYEIIPQDAFCEFAPFAEATGVVSTVFSGSDLLQQEGPVALVTANALPVYPDSFFLNDPVVAGDRLQVLVRNTTAGAIISGVIVRITFA